MVAFFYVLMVELFMTAIRRRPGTLSQSLLLSTVLLFLLGIISFEPPPAFVGKSRIVQEDSNGDGKKERFFYVGDTLRLKEGLHPETGNRILKVEYDVQGRPMTVLKRRCLRKKI